MSVYKREIIETIERQLETDPVLLLEGPRAVGKSTLMAEVGNRLGAKLIDLDDPTIRLAVQNNPAYFVAGVGTVCIDEYQKAPVLLDAIKAELNRNASPGRFLLAGSTNFDSLPKGTQALSGRLGRIRVEPLTQAEIFGRRPLAIGNLQNPETLLINEIGSTSRTDYHNLVLAGGFPLALNRAPATRSRWADDYLSLSLSRDIEDVAGVRNKTKLQQVLTACAARTGELMNISKLAADMKITEITADSYVRALIGIFLLEELPAWGVTLASSVKRKPKLHMVDSQISARLLRITAEKLEDKNPSTLTEFGHVLESFLVAEIRRLASFSSEPLTLGHWRIDDEVEVDLVIEAGDGKVVAIEVKAATTINPRDLRGINRLSTKLGSQLESGIIFYLGPAPIRLSEKIWALPLDTLWSKPSI